MNEFTLKQIEKIWGNRVCAPGYAYDNKPSFKTIEHLKEQYDSLPGPTGMIFLIDKHCVEGFSIHRIIVDKTAP